MPGTFVKRAGAWVEIDATHVPKAKVTGTWKDIKEIHVKRTGAWIRVWPPIAPPTPTNLRLNFYGWTNSRYEVQPVWDPVSPSSLIDGYQLEVTRTGGSASPASAALVDTVMINYWQDIYCGTTAGAVLTYRVRSYKSGYFSPWSAPITTTTPADAGFAKCTGIGVQGTVWGAIFHNWQHDGNPQNVNYDLYRQLTNSYNFKFIKRGGIPSNPWSIIDSVDYNHYRGTSAGTSVTGNMYSDNTIWAIHCVNTWGKPNGNPGPYSPDWGHQSNQVEWKFSNPADLYVRLLATGHNVYRRQPSNSVGWVGGVPRCGGGGGDMETLYMWTKGLLTDIGLKNRVRGGNLFQLGLGRRSDGGPTTSHFNVGWAGMSWGDSQSPVGITVTWGSRDWQRLQGELFTFSQAMCNQWTNPADPTASFAVFSTNDTAGYAEFGYIGEVMGGFVNGQLVMYGPHG